MGTPMPCLDDQCTHCDETDELCAAGESEVQGLAQFDDHQTRPEMKSDSSCLSARPTHYCCRPARQVTSHRSAQHVVDVGPPDTSSVPARPTSCCQPPLPLDQSVPDCDVSLTSSCRPAGTTGGDDSDQDNRTAQMITTQKELVDEEGLRCAFQYEVTRWAQYAHRDKCHELYKKHKWKGLHPPPKNKCRGFPCPCTQVVTMAELDQHIQNKRRTLRLCQESVDQLQRRLALLLDTSTSNNVKDEAGVCAVRLHRQPREPQTEPETSDVSEQLEKEIPMERMARLQREDSDIGPIVRLRETFKQQPPIGTVMLESDSTKLLWSQWEMLLSENGVLFRQIPAKYDKPETKQMLIPAAVKADVIRRSHTGMCAGHLGVRKTLEQVRRRAYWSGWRKDVTRFCRRCDSCNRYCRGRPQKAAGLQPIASGMPWERLSIDLTGPHPRSKRGSVFICTCTDHWSKWSEAFAIPNKEAVTVARVLTEQVFCRMGVPLSILSDQGTEVDSSVMKELCRLLDIEKMHTTTYHPACNAQVERFHRTFNSMMAKVMEEDQSNWDRYIPYVLAAYRSTQHDSTGYSPNYLMLGREVRAGIDVVYGTMPEAMPTDHDSYVEEVEKRRRVAYCLVRQQLHRTAERNRRYYNIGLRPRTFQLGDKVYYFSPRKLQGKQDKRRKKRQGPLEVVKLLGPVNVLIQKSARTNPFVVHVDKLTPYLIQDGSSCGDGVPAERNQEGQESEEAPDGLGANAGYPDEDAGRDRPRRTVKKPARYQD
jgi:hypothetical protein